MSGIAPSASPLSGGSLAQLTLSLMVIIALLFAIGWVLKRTRVGGARGGSGQLRVLAELALSPRERVLLLRVGDSQVLLGIGAGGMVGLTPLATPIVLPPAPTTVPAFADRLREFMKRPGATK
jgi:flagellar protein FliO/FliZ